MTGLFPLTFRVLRGASRDLDVVFAVLAPVIGVIGATVGLRSIIDTGGMSYAQYVVPAIVVQSMLFGALTTTDRAAEEQTNGFGERLRTLPISPTTPLVARMLYCVIRGGLAVAAAVGTAYLFGFQMAGGFWYGAAFVLIALTLTLALSLGADAAGTKARRVGVASQLLMIPQFLLVALSTGYVPATAFPDWIQSAVRYQPISQLTETLRGFTSGHVVGSGVAASLAWCIGLLVLFGVFAWRAQRRSE